MATTTNYGWETADDTDLVKDGALAMRTLGSAIDTTVKALNPSTTLGDIEYRSSTANTNTRLGIGSTGTVLTVAGGVPTWAAPASGGGMTLINTGGTSFSGSDFTISSIPSTYKQLRIWMINPGINGTGWIELYINGSASGYYGKATNGVSSLSTSTKSNYAVGLNDAADITGSQTNNTYTMDIINYASTSEYKPINMAGNFTGSGGLYYFTHNGEYRSTTAISSLKFVTNQTFNAGKVYVYGVN